MSFAAQRRTKEFGIRIAFGASRSSIIRLVLGEVSGLIAGGIVIGTLLSFIFGELLQGLLYGFQPADPPIIGAAIIVIGVVSLLAGSVPAFRSIRISPVRSLRYE